MLSLILCLNAVLGKLLVIMTLLWVELRMIKFFAPLTFFLLETSIETSAFDVFFMKSPTIKYASALNRQS